MRIELKKQILLLDIFLVLSLLSYALMLCLTNKNLNYMDVSGDSELIQRRFFLKNIANRICDVGGIIYIIGCIMILRFNSLKFIPLRKIVLCFLAQAFLIFTSVVLIALFDIENLSDYLFPVWSILIGLLFCFFYSLFKLYRQRKEE